MELMAWWPLRRQLDVCCRRVQHGGVVGRLRSGVPAVTRHQIQAAAVVVNLRSWPSLARSWLLVASKGRSRRVLTDGGPRPEIEPGVVQPQLLLASWQHRGA